MVAAPIRAARSSKRSTSETDLAVAALVLLQNGSKRAHPGSVRCGLRFSSVFVESFAHGLEVGRVFAAGPGFFDFGDRCLQRSEPGSGERSAAFELSDVGLADDQILRP